MYKKIRIVSFHLLEVDTQETEAVLLLLFIIFFLFTIFVRLGSSLRNVYATIAEESGSFSSLSFSLSLSLSQFLSLSLSLMVRTIHNSTYREFTKHDTPVIDVPGDRGELFRPGAKWN